LKSNIIFVKLLRINPKEFFINNIDKWAHCAYTVHTEYIQYVKGGAPLDLIISNASDQPIYEQIFSQIKNSIVSGKLREGDALPSIRALAKDLRISVITTKRAYDELERAGYINTVAGKGCFVAEKNIEVIREEHLKEIEVHIQRIVELAAALNMSENEIFEIYKVLKMEGE